MNGQCWPVDRRPSTTSSLCSMCLFKIATAACPVNGVSNSIWMVLFVSRRLWSPKNQKDQIRNWIVMYVIMIKPRKIELTKIPRLLSLNDAAFQRLEFGLIVVVRDVINGSSTFAVIDGRNNTVRFSVRLWMVIRCYWKRFRICTKIVTHFESIETKNRAHTR